MAWLRFFADYIKSLIIRLLTSVFSRLRLPVQQVFCELHVRGHIRGPMKGLELFGMHGVWQTQYYLREFDRLEFFDIEMKYLKMAKWVLGNSRVNYHHADSLAYLASTTERFDMVIADTPHDQKFYGPSGLPLFWEDLQRCGSSPSILLFNIHTELLGNKLENVIRNSASREILDLFFVYKNNLISYAVLVLK